MSRRGVRRFVVVLVALLVVAALVAPAAGTAVVQLDPSPSGSPRWPLIGVFVVLAVVSLVVGWWARTSEASSAVVEARSVAAELTDVANAARRTSEHSDGPGAAAVTARIAVLASTLGRLAENPAVPPAELAAARVRLRELSAAHEQAVRFRRCGELPTDRAAAVVTTAAAASAAAAALVAATARAPASGSVSPARNDGARC